MKPFDGIGMAMGVEPERGLEIQVNVTCADGKAFYRVDMLWRDLPNDRRPRTGGYTQIFSADTGATSKELCSLVWLMMPDEHFQMEYGDDRLRDRELWEYRARVVEEKIIRKVFQCDTDLSFDGSYFQMDWPWIPPNVRERHLPIGPFSTSILLFQDVEGCYQCFLPDSDWLAQYQDIDSVTRYYSSAQGVELALVWAHHFLDHQYAGVRP